MGNVKISVLNDDRCFNELFKHCHGLSLFVETEHAKVLFDVGQDDSYFHNAKTLGLNLDEAKCLVLSHGHYDHSDGLVYLKEGSKIICHPNCTIWRRAKKTGKYNGLPYSKEDFTSRFDVTFSKEPVKISEDIYFLGQIERKTDFECKEFPSTIEDGSDDIALDDTGMAIKTSRGLIIISGCGHSGICNTVEQARKVTGCKEVLAVLGGFHLKTINNQVEKTIEYFEKIKVKELYLGHCTSDEVCDYFKQKLNGSMKVELLFAGLVIKF